jgi:putative endonuclease
MEKTFYLYLMTNADRGVFYIGVTAHLQRRVYEHRNGLIEGFTKRYNLVRLVWCETFADGGAAILQEKRIKRWRRPWKIEMVERRNPHWLDLYESLNG